MTNENRINVTKYIKIAVKILKGVIKNPTHQTDFYSTIDGIRGSKHDRVPGVP